MNTIEIWKEIEGYEGLYAVSDHGKIKSLERKVATKGGGERTVRERILATALDGPGYEVVALCKEGTRKAAKVHRLVAETFIEQTNPEQDMVNHIDGVKTNNHVSNLEWTTNRENLKHASDTGLTQVAWKPVIINDIEFDSQCAAVAHFEMSETTLRRAIKSGATKFTSRGNTYTIGGSHENKE